MYAAQPRIKKLNFIYLERKHVDSLIEQDTTMDKVYFIIFLVVFLKCNDMLIWSLIFIDSKEVFSSLSNPNANNYKILSQKNWAESIVSNPLKGRNSRGKDN